jgi:hypothetical protein
MGIRDRDYMKRPAGDDGEDGSSSESRAEEFAQRVLARSRKLILIGGIVLAILIVVALIVSKFSGSH